ncbi:hypothetical protein [Kitasatospora camelliae]|uniref:SWIM zinc finger protein n=1 Tax=Kitasatospora camelliae TaxID=3156397 RepID=A0AAU8K4J5_9ACTN
MTQYQSPAVEPSVVAELVAGLSARLQKRLDGAVAKLAAHPPVQDGESWRIAVDEEVTVTLRAPAGVVRTAGDVHCTCLLAPACLHRAAAASAAPLAEQTDGPAAGSDPQPDSQPDPQAAAVPPGEADPLPDPLADPLTEAEAVAVERLRRSAAEALAAGVSGAGAVVQAELLRSAHQARLLGLHRAAAAAVAVVTRLRAARSAEPDHRLADLLAAHRELLATTTALLAAPSAALRGTARQAYRHAGGLRLYGLFAEPVLTATHAGVLTWLVDAEGRLSTVAEITPHADPAAAAPQAVQAADRAVRLGDTSLTHRRLGREGLLVQGATRSESGRLGAGAGVKAVRAAGAGWFEPPLAALWEQPPSVQVERALAAGRLPYEARPAGSDLLFLDVTLLGPASPGGQYLAADCAGLTVRLLAAHDHPGLAHRDNLAMLASAPGLRLRVVGRLERAAVPRVRLLAAGAVPGADRTVTLVPDRHGRLNLGLERLQSADLPAPGGDRPVVEGPGPVAEPPVHLLTRRVEQVVTGGRRALALPAPPRSGPGAGARAAAGEAEQLRAAGLATAAGLGAGLRSAAAEGSRDVFGRLRTDDHLGFALAWLAAAGYGEELATALCAAGWRTGD